MSTAADDHEAFPWILAHEMPLNVVNLGVLGYGTDQELVSLEAYLEAHPALNVRDVVVFVAANDFTDVQVRLPLPGPQQAALPGYGRAAGPRQLPANPFGPPHGCLVPLLAGEQPIRPALCAAGPGSGRRQRGRRRLPGSHARRRHAAGGASSRTGPPPERSYFPATRLVGGFRAAPVARTSPNACARPMALILSPTTASTGTPQYTSGLPRS